MSKLRLPKPHKTPRPHVKDLERLLAVQLQLLWCGPLDGRGEMLPLCHQLLLELLLRLGVQEFLPEGDVGEHGGKRPAQLNGRFGAFLRSKKERGKLECMNYWSGRFPLHIVLVRAFHKHISSHLMLTSVVQVLHGDLNAPFIILIRS